MTKYIYTFFIFFSLTFCLSAQTIKTKVVVVGHTPASVSAAIQAARSGVKTLLVTETAAVNPAFTADDLVYLDRIKNHFVYKGKKRPGLRDSLLSKKLSLEEAPGFIKNLTDTVKNLTVLLNAPVQAIKKSGRRWELKLQNGRTVKANVVVDATQNLSAAALVKADTAKTVITLNQTAQKDLYENKLYRASAAIAYLPKTEKDYTVFSFPLACLLPVGLENFLFVPGNNEVLKPVSMAIGQAAGASAAYCAFFKTTTENLNVRVIQGELLGYDARLFSFTDIRFNDPDAVAYQHIGVTGLLKAKFIRQGNANEMRFDTAGTVSSEELKLPMKEYYSRSQIWFADHTKEVLTIEDVINMLMFTATRGEELRREIEKNWKESFKFKTVYDPKRAISRKEFAILAETYLQPFNVKVDLYGNLQR